MPRLSSVPVPALALLGFSELESGPGLLHVPPMQPPGRMGSPCVESSGLLRTARSGGLSREADFFVINRRIRDQACWPHGFPCKANTSFQSVYFRCLPLSSTSTGMGVIGIVIENHYMYSKSLFIVGWIHTQARDVPRAIWDAWKRGSCQRKMMSNSRVPGFQFPCTRRLRGWQCEALITVSGTRLDFLKMKRNNIHVRVAGRKWKSEI